MLMMVLVAAVDLNDKFISSMVEWLLESLILYRLTSHKLKVLRLRSATEHGSVCGKVGSYFTEDVISQKP